MCIIAAKPAGVKMPSNNYISNMFDANPDGAGIMYAVDGKVHIEKGFMKEHEFYDNLEKLGSKYDLEKLPLVMHFRITTHGGTKAENCHPFPISDSMGMLKKLRCRTDIGVAHNGIINISQRNKDISDTMEYIAGQLAPLKRAVRRFYKSKDLLEMISNAIDSKMVIMDEEGEMYFIGDFWEEEGVRYSNKSYKYDKYCYRSYAYSNSSGWYDDEEYTTRYLMWLDEKAGEYVRYGDGELYSGDEFAIDSKEKVYYYDMDIGMFVSAGSMEAVNAEGMPLKYKWERAIRELVMKEEYYE